MRTLIFLLSAALHAQTAADWPMYNRDLAGTRYSPLTQINVGNVAKLTQAWTYRTGGALEVTPIVVNGVMYLPAGKHVAALEPETGEEIWRYELTDTTLSRGAAFWPGDKTNPPRILFTDGPKLVALNAKTGKLDPGFGNEGTVDMTVPYSGVPTIYKNVVMVGATTGESPLGPPGNARAYDARTGKKLWEFRTVPQPGEPGSETWLNDGWKNRSGVSTWGWYMTVDEQRGIVYMPLGGPGTNYYGGDRPGANLYGNSLMAIDAVTGKYKWHFQAVHHDMWDYDLPPAPGLIDVVRNGKKIPALAQVGKIGYMFILDRVTGKPIYGVEERPVTKGEVPGEWYSPTQPFPLKPPPIARMNFKPEDLVTAEDTTPEHAAACRELFEKNGGLYNTGPYTPWFFHAEGAPMKSTVNFPGGTGGTNWGGTATDPKLGYVFVRTQDQASMGFIEKARPGVKYLQGVTGLGYERATAAGPSASFFQVPVRDASGAAIGNWPCQKPPWGRLTAVNVNTGEFAWQVPLGVTDQLPEGKQNTGRPGFAGPIATAGGIVFIGATSDNRFRAIDSKTGKELWVTKLERTANAVPMTYQGKNGKQYVAVVATDTVAVFALP